MASPQLACPSWCTNDPCSGVDHSDTQTFTPATGGPGPAEVAPETGATFPIVGVGVDHCRGWSGPALVLWLTGVRGIDENVFLRPAEAAQLVRELEQRLRLLADGTQDVRRG